jgi:hypothetical protein
MGIAELTTLLLPRGVIFVEVNEKDAKATADPGVTVPVLFLGEVLRVEY